MSLDLEPLNVLIGPNGSGKSNLIEAISLLAAAPRDLLKPLREGGGTSEWLWKGHEKLPTAQLLAFIEYGRQSLLYQLGFTAVDFRLKLLEEEIFLLEETEPKQAFVADPDALTSYYGPSFQSGALPRRRDVEGVPKEDLARSLDRATQQTQKGRYHKIRHGSDLLGRLSQERVRSRARHCDLLFTTLESLIRT